MKTTGSLPSYEVAATMNGWGSPLRIYRWGCRVGPVLVVWFDLFTYQPCLKFSKIRKTR